MFEARGRDMIRTAVNGARTSPALLYSKADIEQGRPPASMKKNSVKMGGLQSATQVWNPSSGIRIF